MGSTFFGLCTFLYAALALVGGSHGAPAQAPLLQQSSNDTTVSAALFAELEELARIVDISYCVGTAGLGIQKPFQCVSRCSEFENFELVTVRSPDKALLKHH
jgi:hypothetical protein